MTEFPSGVYSPRTKENKSDVIYEPLKKTNSYAEDITNLDDEIVAIETILGANPEGAFATLKARIVSLEDRVTALEI